jgi:hypothetical protein
MIKFKDDRIALAALNTRMFRQILPKEPSCPVNGQLPVAPETTRIPSIRFPA